MSDYLISYQYTKWEVSIQQTYVRDIIFSLDHDGDINKYDLEKIRLHIKERHELLDTRHVVLLGVVKLAHEKKRQDTSYGGDGLTIW